MSVLTGNFYTDVLAVLVSILVVIGTYYKWAINYWQRKGVTTPETQFPFGNGKNVIFQKLTFGVDVQNAYKEFRTKGLRYGGYYFLTKPTFVVTDPELLKFILTKDFMHFTSHGNYTNEKNDPLSGNLFMIGGKKWKNLRIKLTPTFTSGKMKMMFQKLLTCGDELNILMEKVVKDQPVVDIKDIVGRFTTDIIGTCGFGLECNTLKNPDSEFRYYGKKVFHTTPAQALKGFLAMHCPVILDIFKIPFFPQDVIDFFLKIVKDTANYREANQIIQKDFLHLLIQLKNNIKIKDDETVGNLKSSESGKNLTMEELTAQAFLFFIAGFETSSTTLTFCLFELSCNTEVQNKLRNEINLVLEKYEGNVTYDALMEMDYMEKCIDETLRKYPPVPTLTRECEKDYKIPDSDVVLEKGTFIIIPTLGIHRDSEYYPDPETFDPERFSSESKSERHPYTWLPFGEGPRMCLGLRFGVMQTKVALTYLLRDFKFTLNSKTKTPIFMDPASFILNAVGGIWLDVAKVTK